MSDKTPENEIKLTKRQLEILELTQYMRGHRRTDNPSIIKKLVSLGLVTQGWIYNDITKKGKAVVEKAKAAAEEQKMNDTPTRPQNNGPSF